MGKKYIYILHRRKSSNGNIVDKKEHNQDP